MSAFPPFKGALSPEEAARGIEVAVLNAKSLVEDARVLFEARRWPRVVALSILAVEEAGKVGILRQLLLARNHDERKDGWRAYRSHTDKNAMATFLDAVGKHVQTTKRLPLIDDMRSFVVDKHARRQTEHVKQLAIYTDCVADGRWLVPEDVVEEEARAFLEVGELIVEAIPGPMTSVEELRLWVKHLAPTWMTDMASMKRSLSDCFAEAAATGVLRGLVSPDRMKQYLGLEPGLDADGLLAALRPHEDEKIGESTGSDENGGQSGSSRELP